MIISPTTPPRSDEDMRQWLAGTAERDGAAVIHISETEDTAPFAFSVGLWSTCGRPEVIVVGLPPEAARVLVNAYIGRSRKGQVFAAGMLYKGFLDNCGVTFEHVAHRFYPEWLGHGFLMYGAAGFPCLQMLVSTPDGAWPWDADAPEGLAEWQPVLTASGRPESWTPGTDGP